MFFLTLFKFTHGDKSPTPFSCSARANGETVASSVILGAWENHPKKRYTNYPINYFHSHTSIGMSLIPFSNSKSFEWNICSDKKGVGLEQNIKEDVNNRLEKGEDGFWVKVALLFSFFMISKHDTGARAPLSFINKNKLFILNWILDKLPIKKKLKHKLFIYTLEPQLHRNK